jgi:hypothetical protein
MGRTLNYYGLNIGPIVGVSVINLFTDVMKTIQGDV